MAPIHGSACCPCYDLGAVIAVRGQCQGCAGAFSAMTFIHCSLDSLHAVSNLLAACRLS